MKPLVWSPMLWIELIYRVAAEIWVTRRDKSYDAEASRREYFGYGKLDGDQP